MAGASNIEWTDATWNPVVGCSIVSPGCTNCYAMKMAGRIEAMKRSHYDGTTKPSNGGAVWTGKVALAHDEILTQPLRWKKPRKIFVNSMGDLFHESIPDEWIDRVFAVMALSPQHTFQVLTKRADRMRAYMKTPERGALICGGKVDQVAAIRPWPTEPSSQKDRTAASEERVSARNRLVHWPLPNVWLGVSTERQQEADERLIQLVNTPAAVRFISYEPALGPLQLRGNRGVIVRNWLGDGGIDWVICGGESGSGARPMHPDWARSLRDQCDAAGVPFFFKQWGEFAPSGGFAGAMKLGKRSCAIDKNGKLPPGDPKTTAGCLRALNASFDGDYEFMSAVGKAAAGRLLDGKEHNAFPEAKEVAFA